MLRNLPSRLSHLICAVLAFAVCCSTAWSQQSPLAFLCGEPELRKPGLEQNPNLKVHLDQWEQIWQRTVRGAATDRGNDSIYTIPVVVHLIHQNGPENIPDAQVLAALEHLNAAFAHTGYYQKNGLGADTGIQFCLAQRGPDDEPAKSIIRVESPLTDMDAVFQDWDLKNLSRWDTERYLNIWIVREISSNSLGKALSAYAFNAWASGTAFDGVVIEAQYVGVNPAKSNVLAHEVGHYFNLYHTFERGCPNEDCVSQGDFVCDTPPDNKAGGPCANNSCESDWYDATLWNPFFEDVDDYTWNFMDYAPEACYSGFTGGQAARMRLTLTQVRASLLTSRGCWEECPVATIKTTPAHCFGEKNGSIEVTSVRGGYPPFVFALNQAPAVSSGLFPQLKAGTYTIRILDRKQCAWETTIEITQPPLVRVQLSGPAVVPSGKPYDVQAHISPDNVKLKRIEWTPAPENPSATLGQTSIRAQSLEPTLFSVRVSTENACVATDTLWVLPDPARSVYLPNAISLSDQAELGNHVFTLFGNPGVKDFDLFVFDRWGNNLYQKEHAMPNDWSDGWDGYVAGQPVAPGVFFYRIRVRYWDGGTDAFSGELSVFR